MKILARAKGDIRLAAELGPARGSASSSGSAAALAAFLGAWPPVLFLAVAVLDFLATGDFGLDLGGVGLRLEPEGTPFAPR